MRVVDTDVLTVNGLTVEFQVDGERRTVVRDVSLSLRPGEKLALVGESGCGKSTLALSLLGLLEWPGRIVKGEIILNGRDILGASERQLSRIRGTEISLIYQDPMGSLDPVKTIGNQVLEAVKHHNPDLNRKKLQSRVLRLMQDVGVENAKSRVNDYPHQFSGGMLQRVMIAIALANKPKVLVADEPTTALDVTTQAKILELIDQLASERGTAVILITHDLGVVAEFCDRVDVMYAGHIVESSPSTFLFDSPSHPYTAALLNSVVEPGMDHTISLPTIPGAPPKFGALPQGCSFEPRCPIGHGRTECLSRDPVLVELAWRPSVSAACHFSHEISASAPDEERFLEQ